jgi:cysteine-rich repeat protein
LSGTATDGISVTKIEIYLDGTSVGNKKQTCNTSGTAPAACTINVGALSLGSHTTTVKAYDGTSITTATDTFSVGSGATCGDSTVTSPEVCDDGNQTTETSCAYGSATCSNFCSATCSAVLNLTGHICGDGTIQTGNGEECDDNGTANGDGCSSSCQVETGWTCTGAPSVCIGPPVADTFPTNLGTTDFTAVSNYAAVPAMKLAKSEGSITWTNPVMAGEQNFDNNIKIGAHFVSLNVSALHATVDAPARVSLAVSSCDNPVIYYATGYRTSLADIKSAGQVCNGTTIPACTSISCSANVVSFSVPHFDAFGVDNPPVITAVSHSPSSPVTGIDSVILSGSATSAALITSISLYLDGTAPGNLKHTCTYAPARSPATCAFDVGTLTAGPHTLTVRADNGSATTDGSESFTVLGGATGNAIFNLDVLNSAPTVSNIKVCTTGGDGAGCEHQIVIAPNINADKTYYVFADVNDNNGASDIASAHLAFYRELATNGVACTSDGNDCYSGITCTQDSIISATTIRYVCSVSIKYWIDPTVSGSDDYAGQNWIASVTATDNASGTGTNTGTTQVDQVLALAGFPPIIDYGSHILGFESDNTNNVTATITQVGNVDADIQIKADSATMTCSGIGSIDVGQQKFDSYASQNPNFSQSTKTLTMSYQNIGLYDGSSSDGAIRRRVTDIGYSAAGHAAFSIQIPSSGVKGICSSTATITTVKHSVAGNGG